MKIPPMFRPIAAELRSLGYELSPARSGHIHIRKEGKFIWGMAGSPSDVRAPKALRTDLRKRGVPLK